MKMRLYNIYLRILLFYYWLIELWNRCFMVTVIERDDGLYIRLRDKLVRLEIYPAMSVNGILIGNNYYTPLKPPVMMMDD